MIGTATRSMTNPGQVTLAHGGGGELMGQLIRDHVLNVLGNETLNDLTDGSILRTTSSRIVFTTDSFVVQPVEFPGGDIGRLAVCGTVNDLAVMGARPLGLSLAFIIEEGFSLDLLDRVIWSIREASCEAGVDMVTGDTKVIERTSGGNLYINTSGVGSLLDEVHLGFERVRPGDAVLINGSIGDHGMAVLSARHGLAFETCIRSDAAPLNGLVASVLDGKVDVRFMRDPTRGGLAGVLADLGERTGLGIDLRESDLPIRPSVQGAADALGFDLLQVANEGKIVFVVPPEQADRCLSILRRHRWGSEASCIGTLVHRTPPLVELLTLGGGRRIVPRPYGEDLPRIC